MQNSLLRMQFKATLTEEQFLGQGKYSRSSIIIFIGQSPYQLPFVALAFYFNFEVLKQFHRKTRSTIKEMETISYREKLRVYLILGKVDLMQIHFQFSNI